MSWQNDLAAEKIRHQAVDDNPPRCARCNKLIPKPRRYKNSVRYCEEACSVKAKMERQSVRTSAKKAAAVARRNDQLGIDGELPYDEKDQTRRDKVYHDAKLLLSEVQITEWIDRHITDAAVAKKLGYTPQAVGMARRALVNDRISDTLAQGWEVSAEHLRMLGPSDAEMRRLLADDPDAYELRLDELTYAFWDWRNEFFHIALDEVYITKEFHLRWIRATLHTIYTGGRQLILSPPRHGKTDLLIHFCVWLIVRDPNIRILWVGPNADIGGIALGHVKLILEEHEKLRLAYLGENEYWAPGPRTSNRVWKADRFRVANRTMQRKQPTMWSTGVGGKILSMDADFIVVDDPADPDDSQAPAGRGVILKWFRMKLLTRKMRRTGLVVISSRVHIEDLYSNYTEAPKWEVLVDKAHDNAVCALDLFDDHTVLADPDACVLFPEMNPLDHLQDQCEDVGRDLFDMMFQNMPRPEGMLIFDPDIIAEKCYDHSRGLGLGELPHPVRLVAGLDPAARQVQAAFCWGIDVANDADYMIDLDTQIGGGIDGALDIMRSWHDLYDVRLWVVEDNSYQKVFFDDPRVKALAVELDLTIQPTTTGMNKHDPFFGISSMAKRYHQGNVNLPYGTREAQRKVDMLVRQLVSFTGETGQRSREKTDIRMASWFPYANVIRRWRRDNRPRRQTVVDGRSYVGYEPSKIDGAPWARTEYPG